ncbi:ROK family protein [Candidatus Kaiserbacteria bacterium]|nr:ROK family protein [Candidatus Kaiserbacteria bacterium]
MYIVADIGGTKTRIAAARDAESFTEPVILDTPQRYEDALQLISDTAKHLAGADPIEGFVAGVPVLLSPDKRTIVNATNLSEWSGARFAEDIEQRLGARAHLENDVALIALGEALYGAGQSSKDIVYITISTGVNGAHVIDGQLQPSRGISTGRQYVSMDEPLRTWEQMISGKSISEQYGKPPRELGKEWDGWETLARIAAFGILNTIVHWTPGMVILGGSMMNDIGIPVDRIQAHLARIWTASPEIPQIVHSKLGDIGGLYGGLARLKQLRA